MNQIKNIKTTQGVLSDQQGVYGIVVGRFNSFISERLLNGAIGAFSQHGIAHEKIEVVWVPGAFEIPLAIKTMADKDIYSGLVALGCVIRGATPHFDYVAGTCADSLARIQIENKIPLGFGVLTVDNVEQAIERAGSKAGNKGADAAVTVLEMVSLMKKLK